MWKADNICKMLNINANSVMYCKIMNIEQTHKSMNKNTDKDIKSMTSAY